MTELRVTLPGPEGAADAERAVWVLGKMLELLTALDPDGGGAGEEKTRWAFTRLALGSVNCAIAPGRPRGGRTISDLEDQLSLAVEGLGAAENGQGTPGGWTTAATRVGAEIGRALGGIRQMGLVLGLYQNGQAMREVTVTHRAGENLSAGLRVRRRSIGSLVGRLESATVHGKYVARLWLAHPRRSVEVHFAASQVEVIRAAFGRRVMVAGRMESDASGHPVRMWMRNLDVLPGTREAPPLADMVGIDPDFTGGMDPTDYLRELRGTA